MLEEREEQEKTSESRVCGGTINASPTRAFTFTTTSTMSVGSQDLPELSHTASIPGALADTLFNEHPYLVTPLELERAVRPSIPTFVCLVEMDRLITDKSLRIPA